MGNRIMRHVVQGGFQHQGEDCLFYWKVHFLADIRFQWQLHIYNNSKHVQSIQLTLKSPYWLDHKYAILTSIMQGKKFHALYLSLAHIVQTGTCIRVKDYFVIESNRQYIYLLTVESMSSEGLHTVDLFAQNWFLSYSSQIKNNSEL